MARAHNQVGLVPRCLAPPLALRAQFECEIYFGAGERLQATCISSERLQ